MRTIQFPDMRMNVLYNLGSLSDPSYQRRRWIDHEKYGSFKEVIHCLFDDSCFEDNPRRTINTLLFDEAEADKIMDVMNAIEMLLEKYGDNLFDAEYVVKPEWSAIMTKARTAFDHMKNNDLRYLEPAQRAELYRKYNIDKY